MLSLDLLSFLKQFLYDPKNPLLFNNGFFVLFFSLFMLLYYAFRNDYKIRRYIFCFFSLYFFYKASGYFVALVIISAIADFFISSAIYRARNKTAKKALLFFSIIFNLGLLFYFKYTNFFITLSNDIFGNQINPLNILLPVGISFYTFENLSYTIDIYRGQFKPARKFSDYLLFLSFFPKLVMGPLVRAHDFVPQINKPYIITEKDFLYGFYLIISGLFKKLIISDYLTLNYIDFIFDDPSRYTGIENLTAVYCYAAVIYCDFSGYSDVAIGIGRWLGFNIPANFLSPYQSKNITEFWRRWHISLSSWLKDYLYIPLGGNRKGTIATYLIALSFFTGIFMMCITLFHLSYIWATVIVIILVALFILPAIIKRDKTSIPASFNLLATMLLGGFWHGANWNFIIWGALHGVALAIHKAWILITAKKNSSIKNYTILNFISVILTFHFVCFSWIFFKAPDFSTAQNMIRQILFDFNLGTINLFYANYKYVLGMMLLSFILHTFPDDLSDKLFNKINKVPIPAYVCILFAFILLYGFFKSTEQVLPIYLSF